MTESPHTSTYSIGQVCEKTGLTSRQIRYYESQGLISPIRTQGKQRRFSAGHIERLLRIKALMNEKSSIKAVKEQLDAEEATGSEGATNDELSFLQIKSNRTTLTSIYPISDRAELTRLVRNINLDHPD
ncbi:MAG TPA: MerR family transcriptional regulator [Firmicutes bacterium]|nr:MerR family transcriptional regulator [Bacillota bacterium]